MATRSSDTKAGFTTDSPLSNRSTMVVNAFLRSGGSRKTGCRVGAEVVRHN